jgi:transposase-like protein
MQRAVANQVFLGVSTRNYARAVEDCLEGYGIERSSVSRHFVMASAQKVRELCERRLEDLKLVAVLVDGVEFAGTTVVVALAVAQDGRKHILGFWQGATENATVGTALLEDLVSRGLDPSRQYLFVIDGSKALHKALHQVFGSDLLVQRCQVHKKRNVLDHLPEAYHPALRMRLNTAYGMNDCAEALKAIRATVDWLREYSEGAARSLEEGLEETLTVHRLGLPDALRRSLSSTNIIESCFSMVRARTARVKRWRDDQMIKRWAGTMLLQAEKRFRKVRGYRFMPMLVNALQTKGALASKKKAG